jgi:hypothetical protein
MDSMEIRLANYRTALEQAQRYLTLTLGSAVGVWLLYSPQAIVGPVTVPGAPGQLNPLIARDLLLGFHIIVAALAGYAVETSRRIGAHFKGHADIANAILDHPSIPGSPWPAVRLAVPLISLGLLWWARGFHLFGAISWLEWSSWRTAALDILIIAVHGTLVLYLWARSDGKWSPIRASGVLSDCRPENSSDSISH